MKFSVKLKAFTLIELMISVSIFVIMTTLLLANYPNSLVRTNLFNLSNNTVLLLREAQVKGSSISTQNDTITGYGIYFKNPDKIIYYSDAGSVNAKGDRIYSTSSFPPDITISTVNISAGYSISRLCTTDPCDNLTELTINFTRPVMNAEISPGNVVSSSDNACIEFKTSKNASMIRSIQVSKFGRITSSGKACPQA